MKLGECLTFYLKYYPEMAKLYVEEEDVPSLPEPQDTKERASKVGKAADAEAAAFLERCGELIVAYFSTIGNPKIAKWGAVEKKSEIEKRWSISVAVWPKPNIKSEKMKIGVSFVGSSVGKPEIVTWIWRVGTEGQQQALVHYLTIAGKAKGTWKDMELMEGAVALGRVPIVLPTEGFEIDASPILADVKEAIQRIDQDDLNHLFP